MLIIAHALTGAVLGKTLHRGSIALPLAFLSHYALDAVPHWSNLSVLYPPVAGRYSAEVAVAAVDVAVAAGVVVALARGRANRALILGAAALASAPDLDNLPVVGAWMRSWYVTASAVGFHHSIQTNLTAADWLLGAAPLLLIPALAWWAFRRPGKVGASPASGPSAV